MNYVLQKKTQYGYVDVYKDKNLERVKKYKRTKFYIKEWENMRIINLTENKVI